MKRDISIVTYNYHSLGGIQRSTTTIANALHANGHSVKIISISPGQIPTSHKLHGDIQVITCNSVIQSSQHFISSPLGRRMKSIILNLFRYWKPKRLQFVKPMKEGVERLRDEIMRLNGDSILLVTDVNSMDYVNLALGDTTRPRPKIIGQYKGSVGAVPRSRVHRIVSSYASADLILGLTKEDADLLEKVSNVPVSHIPDPIPSASESYIASERAKYFVALGRLSPEKNYHEAIRAWKPVSERFPGWKFYIYGDGPLKNELSEFVERAGLHGSVKLMGKTDDPLHVLSQARANIVTSDHEGFGLTISEASSVGTPTIAFNSSPGIRLQIEHGKNGILVPKGETSQLTKAIEQLITDSEFFNDLSTGALDHVQNFSVKTIIDKWEAFFDKV